METTLEVLPTRKSGREVHRHCLMRSRRSLRTLEKTDLEQFDLALETWKRLWLPYMPSTRRNLPAGNWIAKLRATNRSSLLRHLPGVEEVT